MRVRLSSAAPAIAVPPGWTAHRVFGVMFALCHRFVVQICRWLAPFGTNGSSGGQSLRKSIFAPAKTPVAADEFLECEIEMDLIEIGPEDIKKHEFSISRLP